MNITPCWHCGAQPVRQTKYFIGVEWAALHCCTTGSYSPHEENTIDSWNRQQKALALLRAVERLSHLGKVRLYQAQDVYHALLYDRQFRGEQAGIGESAADALIKLIERIDQA